MNSVVEKGVWLEARGLVVSYDNFIALCCPQLTLSGNSLALVGHNGAGKSTLIKAILGLLPAKSGTIRLQAKESGRLLQPANDMAFCPESGAVFADISVESYIKFWCRIKHNNSKYYRQAGSKYVEQLELGPLLGKLGRELSKGQCRRVQTAIGFIIQPRLFLFDEPFDGLDVLKTSELTQIIESESNQMSFIISSHRMDVIERLADIVIVLKEGKVVAAGPVEDVCSTLSGQTIMISNLKNRSLVLVKLKELFPTSLIDHLGEMITLTGINGQSSDLAPLLDSLGETTATISTARPSLTDAVNYHLKTLSIS